MYKRHPEDNMTTQKHITTLNPGLSTKLNSTAGTGCGECQASCQSACKTSCTVANQRCRNERRVAAKAAK